MNKNAQDVCVSPRHVVITGHDSSGNHPHKSALRASAQAAALLVLTVGAGPLWAACPSAVSNVITVSSAITSGCDLGTGVSIVISAGGSITSSSAISINGMGTVAGTIQNAGLLEGTADTGIYLYNGATLGAITNTGTIHGLSYGVILNSGTTLTGGITNSGLIHAGDYGLQVDGATLSGGISNSGSISGNRHAILIESSASISGGILNSGHLTSTDDSPFLIDGATVTGGITNSGTIDTTVSSYEQAAIDIRSSEISGGITNTGLINFVDGSEVGSGLYLYNSTLTGSITNAGTIHVLADSSSEAYGINVSSSTVTGGIANSGLIIGGGSSTDTGYGLYVSSSHVSGSITNSGTIRGLGSSDGYGILLDSSTLGGGISNSGRIEGTTSGIELQSSTVTGAINNAVGGVIIGDGRGVLVDSGTTLTGGITNAGLIQGGEYSLKLDNAAAAFNVTNTGTLQGGVDLGINTLYLNGPSSRVIGSTVGTGNVTVNGTFTSEGIFSVTEFNVASTGRFNMNNNVTATGGLVNDGVLNVDAGTRTITGTYTQHAGATFAFSLSDASTHGVLHTTGNATVANGSNVFVNVLGSPTLSNGATVAGIITTGGTLTANAANISVADNSALYKFTAATVSNPGSALDLIIALDPVGLPTAVDAANLPAARGAAQALQTIVNTGVPAAMQPVFDRLNNMTQAQAAEAVSQTLPTLVGAGSQAGVSALHSMNKVIQSRVESTQGLSSGDKPADRYMWVRGFGNWGEQQNRHDVSGFDSNTTGIVVGGDAPVTDRVRAGGAFTYAKSQIDSKSGTSSVDVDTYELVGYASYNIDPRTDINYQIDLGENRASSTRSIAFMGTQAKADFTSVALHGSVGIGRVMDIAPHTNWTPSVRLDYTAMRTGGYTENGGGPLNLDVASQTYREFLLTGDAKFAHQFEIGLKLLTNLSAGYDFINKQAQTTSTFTGGGPAFVTDGLKVSPWFYRFGLGLVKETGEGLEYSLRYDLEKRTSGYLNQTVSAKVRWAF